MRIVLGLAPHDEGQALPAPGLAVAAGPAILAINDPPFRDKDFAKLANLANSGRIVDASRKLSQAGDRGLPHAGAAACIRRNGGRPSPKWRRA